MRHEMSLLHRGLAYFVLIKYCQIGWVEQIGEWSAECFTSMACLSSLVLSAGNREGEVVETD